MSAIQISIVYSHVQIKDCKVIITLELNDLSNKKNYDFPDY